MNIIENENDKQFQLIRKYVSPDLSFDMYRFLYSKYLVKYNTNKIFLKDFKAFYNEYMKKFTVNDVDEIYETSFNTIKPVYDKNGIAIKTPKKINPEMSSINYYET